MSEVKDRNGRLDRLIQRFTSRKLLVWGFGTAFLLTGYIPADDWVALSLAYVGTEAFIDAATAWKHGR